MSTYLDKAKKKVKSLKLKMFKTSTYLDKAKKKVKN